MIFEVYSTSEPRCFLQRMKNSVPHSEGVHMYLKMYVAGSRHCCFWATLVERFGRAWNCIFVCASSLSERRARMKTFGRSFKADDGIASCSKCDGSFAMSAGLLWKYWGALFAFWRAYRSIELNTSSVHWGTCAWTWGCKCNRYLVLYIAHCCSPYFCNLTRCAWQKEKKRNDG